MRKIKLIQFNLKSKRTMKCDHHYFLVDFVLNCNHRTSTNGAIFRFSQDAYQI